MTLPYSAAGEEDQPALPRFRGRPLRQVGGRLLRLAVGDELEGEHRAEAAHLADRGPRATRSRPAACGARRRAPRRAPGTRRSRPRRGPPAPRRTRPGCRRTSRRGRPGAGASITSARPVTAASGSPPPSDLPGDEQVRLDPVVLDRPDRPRAADSRLHLVVDVQDRRARRRAPSAGAGSRAGMAMNPPSPWTGSRTTQATTRVDVALEQVELASIASSEETPRYG